MALTIHVFQPQVPGAVNRLMIMVTPLLKHATKMDQDQDNSVGPNRTTMVMSGTNVLPRVHFGIGLIPAQQLQAVMPLVNSLNQPLMLEV